MPYVKIWHYITQPVNMKSQPIWNHMHECGMLPIDIFTWKCCLQAFVCRNCCDINTMPFLPVLWRFTIISHLVWISGWMFRKLRAFHILLAHKMAHTFQTWHSLQDLHKTWQFNSHSKSLTEMLKPWRYLKPNVNQSSSHNMTILPSTFF